MRSIPALVLTTSLLLAACGDGDTTTPPADLAAPVTDTATASSPAPDAPTPAPTPEPSPTAAAPAEEDAAGALGYGSPAGGSSGAAPSDGAVVVSGTDAVAWDQTMLTVPAGSTTLALTCGSSVPHGLAVEGVAAGARLAACGEEVTVDLAAGTYTFFCTVPGHRDAGMEGTLTVG